MSLTLVLNNIRSTYNVGAMLRTFEGFGGSASGNEVIFSGVTPCPFPHDGALPHETEKLVSKIAKTALGAEKMLKMRFLDNITEFLQAKKREKALIVGLENNISGSRVIPLPELKNAMERLSGVKNPEIILVLGEEVSGISEKIREICDIFAEIPMRGQKESFNVSVAAGIALYELMR